MPTGRLRNTERSNAEMTIAVAAPKRTCSQFTRVNAHRCAVAWPQGSNLTRTSDRTIEPKAMIAVSLVACISPANPPAVKAHTSDLVRT